MRDISSTTLSRLPPKLKLDFLCIQARARATALWRLEYDRGIGALDYATSRRGGQYGAVYSSVCHTGVLERRAVSSGDRMSFFL